jgi:hypothetical protein
MIRDLDLMADRKFIARRPARPVALNWLRGVSQTYIELGVLCDNSNIPGKPGGFRSFTKRRP